MFRNKRIAKERYLLYSTIRTIDVVARGLINKAVVVSLRGLETRRLLTGKSSKTELVSLLAELGLEDSGQVQDIDRAELLLA
jgi:hypothetical protein